MVKKDAKKKDAQAKVKVKTKAKAAPKKAAPKEKSKPEVVKTAAVPQGDTPQAQQIGNLPLNIHAQYVRDISFENPRAPQALRGGQSNPKTKVNFGMDARKLEGDLDGMYEVIISVTAEGHRDGDTVFIAEVQYGVTVSVAKDVPEEQVHPLLLIEIPRLSFPFVRQILSELTVQGGYPPLLLNPVNFHQLYMDRFKKDVA